MGEARSIGRSAERLSLYKDVAKKADGGSYLHVGSDKVPIPPSATEAVLDLLIEREVVFLSTLGVVDARA